MSFDIDNHQEERKDKRPEYELVIPPKDYTAPKSIYELNGLTGAEDAVFEYKNYHNETCYWVRRYEPDETKDGKKSIKPFSYDDATGTWKQRAWSKDRVLYREHRLKTYPKKPVLILEGEKAVNAAEKIFKDYVCVSWQGGTNAVHQTNFRWLENREVVLFPDNDEEGIKAAQHVGKILIEGRLTRNIKIVEIPPGLPTGWDVADNIEIPGMTAEGILKTKIEFTPDDKIWDAIEAAADKRELKKDVNELIENYVYIRDRTDFFEKDTYKFATHKQLTDWYAHRTTSMSKLLLTSKKLVKVHSYMTHAGLKPGVINIKPGQLLGVEPGTYLNNYRPSTVISKKGNVQEIIDYYRWFIGPEEWVIVEQVIAFCVRHPGVKIKWACSFTSVEGGGKGILGQIISAILGAHNVRSQVSYTQLVGKHATLMEGKQFIIINELDLTSMKSIKAATNSLKALVTDPTLIIEPKLRPQQEIPNFFNFFIYGNEDDNFYLRKDSRRYFIVKIEHEQQLITERLEKNGFKDKLIEALEPNGPGPGALKHYFENDVVIPNEKIFHASAPRTAALETLIDRSKSDATRILEEALRDKTWPFATSVDMIKKEYYGFSGLIIRDEFFNRIRNSEQFKGLFFTLKCFEKFLAEHAVKWPNGELTKQIIVFGGQRRRAYNLDDMAVAHVKENGEVGPGRLSQMTEGELGRHWSLFNTVMQQQDQTASIEKYYTDHVLPKRKLNF